MEAAQLSACELFRDVPDDRLGLFLPLCRTLSAGRGKTIFQEGEPARFLYTVTKGRVALEMQLDRSDGTATPPTTIASVGPGEAFGWSAIVGPHRFTLSAKAMESSDLVLMEGRALMETLSRHKETGYQVLLNVVNLLAGRLAETREAFVYDRALLWREIQGQQPA